MLILGVLIFIIFTVLAVWFIVKGVRQGGTPDMYNITGKGYVIFGVIVLIFAIGFPSWLTAKHIEMENAYSSIYDNQDVDYNSSKGSSFTNKYGTSTTKCVVSGCNNYIAKSGDTNCCTTHSNKCGNCKCYIDGDAMYCMSCISSAIGNNKSNSNKSHECYVCGDDGYTTKYGSYYYCSDCLDLVKKYSN